MSLLKHQSNAVWRNNLGLCVLQHHAGHLCYDSVAHAYIGTANSREETGVDFVALVDQVIALLRQRGRVTYRTLQRQFQLDADALTDLLGELRYAHRDAIREDEQGIVWTDDARPVLSR